MAKRASLVLIAALALSACNTWTSSNVQNDPPEDVFAAVSPESVRIVESSLPGTTYTKVSDLRVSVNKTTAFNADPTPEQVIARLREEAASIGANAVINTKISDVQVSAFSWGQRVGTGQAVLIAE